MIKGIILGIVLKEIITTIIYYVTGESEDKTLFYSSPIMLVLINLVYLAQVMKRKAIDKKIDKDFLSKKNNPDFDYSSWRKEMEEKYHRNLAFYLTTKK